jgi:hypothetical protein
VTHEQGEGNADTTRETTKHEKEKEEEKKGKYILCPHNENENSILWLELEVVEGR